MSDLFHTIYWKPDFVEQRVVWRAQCAACNWTSDEYRGSPDEAVQDFKEHRSAQRA